MTPAVAGAHAILLHSFSGYPFLGWFGLGGRRGDDAALRLGAGPPAAARSRGEFPFASVGRAP